MRRTLIKICGITSPEEARACDASGADLLGLVFAFSPRRVTVAQAQAVRAAVPRARLAGVFAPEDGPEAILGIAAACGLDLLQLHGGDWDRGLQLARRTALPVVQGLPGGCADLVALEPLRALHGLLFDLAKGAPAPAAAHEALWEGAAGAVRCGHRVYLAGALAPETVAAAIARVVPFGVDVSRGVERAPGVKDGDRVLRFVAVVKEAG